MKRQNSEKERKVKGRGQCEKAKERTKLRHIICLAVVFDVENRK